MTDKTEGLGVVGSYHVTLFRNDPAMRNTEFQEVTDVPPGSHDLCYLASAQAAVAAERKLTNTQISANMWMQDRITALETALGVAREAMHHAMTENFRHQLAQQKVYNTHELADAIALIDTTLGGKT